MYYVGGAKAGGLAPARPKVWSARHPRTGHLVLARLPMGGPFVEMGAKAASSKPKVDPWSRETAKDRFSGANSMNPAAGSRGTVSAQQAKLSRLAGDMLGKLSTMSK